MEKRVPSLDRCIKMKELGIEFPDSKFYWEKAEKGDCYGLSQSSDYIVFRARGFKDAAFPAPLVSEMLEVMPAEIYIKKMDKGFLAWKADSEDEETCSELIDADTSANALADLLIWLKENNKL